jgi:predicted nucleic-acid-binding Zn-ribbon protein
MKLLAELRCSKCSNTEFKFTKELEGESKETIILMEILAHDGFGWDISTFDIECIKCGNKEDNIIEVTI